MRIAHLSDLHLTEGPRLEEQEAELERIAARLREERVDLVLLTGDVYGRTVPHRSTPAERLVLMRWLASLCRMVVVVPGNHDDIEDILGLAALPLVEVVSTPITLPLLGAEILCLPYPRLAWLLQGIADPPSGDALRALVADRISALLRSWAIDPPIPGVPRILAAHAYVEGASLSGGEVLGRHEIPLRVADLEALDLDYGALGHLHRAQEVAPATWYAGSPWPCDFSEEEPKSWNLVDVDCGATTIEQIPTSCPPRLTLEYRWAQPEGEGEPRWTIEPSAEELARVAGADVRARLVVPAPHVVGCPWPAVLAELASRAHRLTEERTIEPVYRRRAPELAPGLTLAERIEAYWAQLATPPTPEERARALALLEEPT